MAFPTTGVLDDFNRADAANLGANWATFVLGDADMRVISNQAGGGANGNWTGNVWNSAVGADQEAYATLGGTMAGVSFAVYVRVQEYGTSTPDGYAVEYNPTRAGGAAIRLVKLNNNSAQGLAGANGEWTLISLVAGDSIGVEIVGSVLRGFYKQGAGAWVEFNTATDAAYSTGDRIAMEINASTGRFDNFGGGTVATTAVGASLAMPYTLRGRAGASLAMPYTVRAPVGSSRAFPFTLRRAVGSSLVMPFGVNLIGHIEVGTVPEGIGANYPFGNVHTFTYRGKITKLRAYLDNPAGGAGAQPLRAVVYPASSGGVPVAGSAPLGTSTEVTISEGQAAGWVEFTFPTPILVEAGDKLLIGLWGGDQSTGARGWMIAANPAPNVNYYFNNGSYHQTNPPGAWVGATNSPNVSFSVYAVVDPLVAVGRSLALPYTVRAPVGSSRALPYTVKALAGRSVALPFTVRALAGRSLALPYLLGAAVGRSLVLPYDVAAATGEGRYIEVSWLELEVPSAEGTVQPVGRSLVMPYTVRARAGQSLEQPYTVREAVGRSVATPYVVRAPAGRSLAQPFTIQQLAGRSVTFPYLILVTAGRSVALPYLVRAAAGRSLVLPYDVAGPLGVVGRSLVLPYTVRQLSGGSVATPYSITVAVGRSVVLPYSMRSVAGRSLETPYLLRGRAASSLVLPYTVRQRVGQSTALPYTIRVSAGRSLATPYLLRGRAGQSLALPYGVAGVAGSSLAMSYTVRSLVGRSLVLPYTLTLQVGRSLVLPYRISSTAGRSLALSYSIVGRAGAGLVMSYTVRRAVGRSLAMPYSFGNLAGASLEMLYTISAWLPQPHEAFPVVRSAQAVAVLRLSTAHTYRNADAAAILPDEEAVPIRDEALVESL